MATEPGPPKFVVSARTDSRSHYATCTCDWRSPSYAFLEWAKDAAAAHSIRNPNHYFIERSD